MPSELANNREAEETVCIRPINESALPKNRRRPRRVVYYYGDEDYSCIPDGKAEELTEPADANTPKEPVGGCPCCGYRQLPVSPTNPRIGTPTPLGFYAFGITTVLFSVHTAKICPMNMATVGLMLVYGGAMQVICGFLELINHNSFGCTISTTFGAFWIATAMLFLWPTDEQLMGFAQPHYNGGFFLLWTIFVVSLLFGAMRQPLTIIALLSLVIFNFSMQCLSFFTGNDTLMRVVGYEGILTGSLATYLGAAFTMRENYGRSVFPILFHDNFQNIQW